MNDLEKQKEAANVYLVQSMKKLVGILICICLNDLRYGTKTFSLYVHYIKVHVYSSSTLHKSALYSSFFVACKFKFEWSMTSNQR